MVGMGNHSSATDPTRDPIPFSALQNVRIQFSALEVYYWGAGCVMLLHVGSRRVCFVFSFLRLRL